MALWLTEEVVPLCDKCFRCGRELRSKAVGQQYNYTRTAVITVESKGTKMYRP